MRFNSVEARDDSLEAQSFQAQQRPRVQESTRRLQAITNDGSPEPWYNHGQVKGWVLPQRAVTHPSRQLYSMFHSGTAETTPEAGSSSPAPRMSTQEHKPRPILKRKPQNSLKSEQPAAQRRQISQMQGSEDQMHVLQTSYGRRRPDLVDQQQSAQYLYELPAGHSYSLPFPEPPIGNMMRTNPRHTSNPPPPAPVNRRAPVSLPSFNPQRVTLFPPLLPHYNRASPPPCPPAVEDEVAQDLQHWTPELTRKVCEWLQDPETDSRQSELTEIVFGDVHRAHVEGCRPERTVFKLKVTRMTISNRASIDLAPQSDGEQLDMRQLLDWFLVEYSEAETPEADHGLSNYWLLAFPVCAVTKVTCGPAPSVRPDDTGANNANALHTTTWTLGRTNRLPLLHGRGVVSGYLEEFISSCKVGLGQIEMQSFGPLFAHARYA